MQALFFNKETFTLESQQTFLSPSFTWSPWITNWKYNLNGLKFSIVAVRISATNALNEISALMSVYQSLSQPNLLFIGDWKAGCSFTNSTLLSETDFFKNSTLVWKITNSAKTTVDACPLDRAVSTVAFDRETITKVAPEYLTEFHLKEELSTHYPLTVTFHLGHKPNTAFWIELAVVGGGILLLLSVFTLTVLVFAGMMRLSNVRWGRGKQIHEIPPPTNSPPPHV